MNRKNPTAYVAEKERKAQKANECLKLSLEGYNVYQIGEKLGISKSWAAELIQFAIREIPAENAKEVLAKELLCLEADYKRAVEFEQHFTPIAMLGPVVETTKTGERVMVLADTTKNAAITVLKALDSKGRIRDQRAKYLGLYAPEKHQVTGDVTSVTPAEARRLMQEAFGEVTPTGVAEDSGEARKEPAAE